MAQRRQQNPKASAPPSRAVLARASNDGATLTLVRPRIRAPRRSPRTPVDLLNPYRRAIPLVGRERELASLWEWLESPRPIAVRALTARAGAGKTRIAIELIEQLNGRRPGQWWAGFVPARELRRFAQQPSNDDRKRARPTLAVVDDSASVAEPLRGWLRRLAAVDGRDEGRPLRLLLLDRPATEGGWLEARFGGGFVEAKVKELFDPLEAERLAPLESADQRRAVLAETLEVASSLARCRTPRLPAPGEDAHFDRRIRAAVWGDPLSLMMAALLSMRSDVTRVLELPRTELALRLVDHEIRRLEEGAPEGDKTLLVHMAGVAALAGGLTRAQALDCAREEGLALGLECPRRMDAFVLPALDLGIAQVMPDILAEALVLRTLCRRTPRQQEETLVRAARREWPSVVPFVLRMVQDFDSERTSHPMKWIEALIRAGAADRPSLPAEIEAAMPRHTLALREKAVEVTELLLDRLREPVPGGPDGKLLEEQARLSKKLACRLGASGRREEAVDRAEEAVRLYEQLAAARPDAFLPDLAGSLDNLACRLSALGRGDQAMARMREAVSIHRRLAQARPDAFLPDLATSLTNLADTLSDLGLREEALESSQEAANIWAQLAQTRSGDFLPDLATSLTSLANMLDASGRREEALAKAQEAVRIHEQLAVARPGTSLADWAGSLDHLACRLSALGRSEEALARMQEAASLYRRLAQSRPDAFLSDLATSLANLTDALSASGRHEQALAEAQEAVRIYEQLAQAHPETFLPDFARSCATRGAVLRSLQRDAESADSFEQAIRALTTPFRPFPPAFAPLMIALCRGYLEAALSAQQEFDAALLASVQKALETSGQYSPRK